MWLDRAWWHRTLPRIWQTRNTAARLLRPLSVLYGRVAARQRQRSLEFAHAPLPVPVLVVGNVVAGGAGKTPATMAIVRHFQTLGVAVGVVSRGYGRSPQAPACLAVTADTDAGMAGDEPVLIHLRTGAPVVVCADRTRAARELLALFPATRLILCDDGLQHYALPRDGEICIIDERGIGNGWLLPAGPLREPWPRKTDLVLESAAPVSPVPYPAGQAVYRAQRSLHTHAVRGDQQQHALDAWVQAGQPVIAVAGIAQPERFFHMLEATGLVLAARHALPDHASHDAYSALARTYQGMALPVLCTEKDAVKLWDCMPQAWAVPLLLEPERAFFAALSAWWLGLPHRA